MISGAIRSHAASFKTKRSIRPKTSPKSSLESRFKPNGNPQSPHSLMLGLRIIPKWLADWVDWSVHEQRTNFVRHGDSYGKGENKQARNDQNGEKA